MFRFALVFLALVSAIRSTDVESKIGQEVSSVPVQDDETQLPALIPIIKVDEIGLGQPAAGTFYFPSYQKNVFDFEVTLISTIQATLSLDPVNI